MDERAAGLKQVFWNPEERRLRTLFRVPVALSIGLLAGYLVVSVVGVAAGALGLSSTLRTILVLALVFLSLAVVAAFIDQRSLRDLGFGGGAAWIADLVAGLAVGLLMVAVAAGALLAAGAATIGGAQSDAGTIGFVGLLAGLLFYAGVGLVEEFTIRGYLLVNIAEGVRGVVDDARTAVLVAVVGTAALFGFLHAANPGGTTLSLLNITLAGLFFGLVYAVTGRLAFPIGVHITWNFGLGPVFGLPVSGLPAERAIFEVVPTGATLLTGGSFGPEGGLVMLVALAAGVGSFLGWQRLRGGALGIDERIAIPDLWSR
jgi:membrane protease YdiL (CAAX protease family)